MVDDLAGVPLLWLRLQPCKQPEWSFANLRMDTAADRSGSQSTCPACLCALEKVLELLSILTSYLWTTTESCVGFSERVFQAGLDRTFVLQQCIFARSIEVTLLFALPIISRHVRTSHRIHGAIALPGSLLRTPFLQRLATLQPLSSTPTGRPHHVASHAPS